LENVYDEVGEVYLGVEGDNSMYKLHLSVAYVWTMNVVQSGRGCVKLGNIGVFFCS
jgi:hypothetical protein